MNGSARPTRIGLLGLFGVGNIGNEGTLTSAVRVLAADADRVDLSLLSWDPLDSYSRHGLPGTRFTLVSAAESTSAWARLAKVLLRLVDIPRAFRIVGRHDAVVVPGMGVLEEQIGVRPWGLPYWLGLYSACCKLRRRPFALVSVGADEVKNPLTRALFRKTLQNADYRTFRDQYSRDCARGFLRGELPGPVLADLAFAIGHEDSGSHRPGTVAVGVMTYFGPDDDTSKGREVHLRYVTEMSQFIEALLRSGRQVRLMPGDTVDLLTADALIARLEDNMPDLPLDRLSVTGVRGLEGLVQEMAACDAVVASRYHNVVSGLIAGRPTVSVGYGPKNAEVMRSVGLGAYCQDLVSMDHTHLLHQLEQVEAQWPSLQASVATRVDEFREEARAQLQGVLALAHEARSAARPARSVSRALRSGSSAR